MPTVARIGPYRVFFYASDRAEPPHVHIERERRTAKFWLAPVRLDRSRRFTRAELGRIERLVTEHESSLLRGWRDYFIGD
jgi:hypothetical protein